jgi:hypothetical protein
MIEALVFLVTLAFYVAGLAPDAYWLDSSELAAAAFGLGVAHPPGHPLPSLLGRLCAFVPFGSIALRVGLASALAGAGAAAQTARLGRLVARRVRTTLRQNDNNSAAASARIDALVGGAAGLVFGLSYAAAFQAVRPEVYALSALLVVSAAYELLRYDETADRRRLYLASLWAGLALSNHHLLALALVVPALALFVPRLPLIALFRSGLAILLGLSLWSYLPLRAATHPLVDWGAPTTPARLYWTVSARAFQKAVARGQVSDVAGVAWALAGELYLVGLFAALAGAYLLLRVRRVRLALLLLGAALFDAAAPALVGFDPANPDAYGYLEAAVALFAALACALPAALASMTSRRRPAEVILVIVVALILVGGAAGSSRWSRSRFWDAGTIVGRFLDGAPPRALLVSSDFQTIFMLWYLQSVEARRPDVTVMHRHFLAYPGYRDELLRHHPWLEPLIGARDIEPDIILTQPTMVLEYDQDLEPRLIPRSVLVQMTISTPLVAWEPQTRRYAAWQAFLAAQRACKLGDGATAALERARWLLGLAELNCDRALDPVTIRRE